MIALGLPFLANGDLHTLILVYSKMDFVGESQNSTHELGDNWRLQAAVLWRTVEVYAKNRNTKAEGGGNHHHHPPRNFVVGL